MFGSRERQREALRRELRIDSLLDAFERGGMLGALGGGAGGAKESPLVDVVAGVLSSLAKRSKAPAPTEGDDE